MTEEKKEELRQLLSEAMENLKILSVGGYRYLSIPVEPYRKYLQQCWASYGMSGSSLLLLPCIISEVIKSRLLEFIREELSPFIHENEIRSASYAIKGDTTHGFCLHHMQSELIGIDSLLNHFLRIAIAYGIEKAVLDFHRCSCLEGRAGSFSRHRIT